MDKYGWGRWSIAKCVGKDGYRKHHVDRGEQDAVHWFMSCVKRLTAFRGFHPREVDRIFCIFYPLVMEALGAEREVLEFQYSVISSAILVKGDVPSH